MQNILKIPPSTLEDYHSQSMFILSYRISLLNAFLFSILALVHVSDFDKDFFLCLAVLAVSLFSLWYMRQSGNHFLVAKATVLFGTIFVQYNVYNLLNIDRFIDMLWIIIIVLYSFFAISRNWGILLLAINFLGITFHQQIIGGDTLIAFSEHTTGSIIDYYLSAIFGGLMICYLLILYNKTQNITTIKYKVANKNLRQKNRIVQQQNQEKTVMLKEIHHRVKNNLQVITSLLRLQSKDIDDPEVIKQFSEATNRVIAMSLIHEKIYQTDNLSDIDISSYFETLTKELIRSYTLGIPIETKITATIKAITPDHMVPFALLLNELTSNSLKHGFAQKTLGKIEIHIKEVNDKIELIYLDNGKWNLTEKKFSFGLELIDTLTEQLEGTYERETENGTRYHFLFPKQ
ncbi:MAG: sensor histidine kinase [Putridiphycobacter sp.]|nr:sensor histidine kinase [Putridiphycobacter sp.]